MSRTLLLCVLVVSAFATTFGVMKLLQRQSTPFRHGLDSQLPTNLGDLLVLAQGHIRLPQQRYDLFCTLSLLHRKSFPAQWAGWILSYFPGSVFGKEVIGNEIDFVVNFHVTAHRDILIGYSKLFASPNVSPDLFYLLHQLRW